MTPSAASSAACMPCSGTWCVQLHRHTSCSAGLQSSCIRAQTECLHVHVLAAMPVIHSSCYRDEFPHRMTCNPQVDSNACKMVYEDNEDEYEDFYDYSALDEDDAEGAEQHGALSRMMCFIAHMAVGAFHIWAPVMTLCNLTASAGSTFACAAVHKQTVIADTVL